MESRPERLMGVLHRHGHRRARERPRLAVARALPGPAGDGGRFYLLRLDVVQARDGFVIHRFGAGGTASAFLVSAGHPTAGGHLAREAGVPSAASRLLARVAPFGEGRVSSARPGARAAPGVRDLVINPSAALAPAARSIAALARPAGLWAITTRLSARLST